MTHHEHVDKGNSVRLLVVDDEPHIADLVATVARYEGWQAATALNGEDALREAAEFQPDIVVLDLMLPDLDGFTVLDRMRAAGAMVPVVFLTARDGTADRVAGLTRGGDDYLVKPFSVEELMARLRAVLRRSTGPSWKRSMLKVSDLVMDEDTREVRRGGKLATLTPTEYELLRYLMRRSPAVAMAGRSATGCRPATPRCRSSTGRSAGSSKPISSRRSSPVPANPRSPPISNP